MIVATITRTPLLISASALITNGTWFAFALRCDKVRRAVATIADAESSPDIAPRDERQAGLPLAAILRRAFVAFLLFSVVWQFLSPTPRAP